MRKLFLLTALVLFATSASGECLLTFQTEVLPQFFVGQPVNFKIEAVSGTPPYRFEVYGDTLPEGFHLNQNGRLTGVPRQEMDTVLFVTLSDAAGCQLTQAFTLTVAP